MIDLDRLEALAKAAADHGENIGEHDWYEADEISSLMHGLIAKADAGLMAGCAPSVILALTAGVRALRGRLEIEDGSAYDGIYCRDETIRQLEAEVRALREDKVRLDSGCIITHERDEFGEEYKCERRGNDLRKMIDEAIAARAKDPE